MITPVRPFGREGRHAILQQHARDLEGRVDTWIAQSLGLNPDKLSPAVVAIQEIVSLAEILLLTGAASLLERKESTLTAYL